MGAAFPKNRIPALSLEMEFLPQKTLGKLEQPLDPAQENLWNICSRDPKILGLIKPPH